MSKQRGLYIEKGKGGLADRSKLFFSPFQTISPRVNTIIIRELGSDRFKLFFSTQLPSTPFHTQYVGSISVIRGWGRDDHFTIFFSTPFGFCPISPLPKTAFGKGGILVHFQIEKCDTFHLFIFYLNLMDQSRTMMIITAEIMMTMMMTMIVAGVSHRIPSCRDQS